MAVWINRPTDSIPRSAAEEITVLVEHADSLENLVKATQSHKPAVTPVEIISAISGDSGLDVATLRKIFNALENLKSLSEEFGGVSSAIDNLFTNLKGDVLKKLVERKDAIVSAVQEYSKDNAVNIAYKAQKLTYLRESVYQEAEIITDARPVFNAKGDEIVEYLITQYFVATFFRNGRPENIHLVMDMADVLKLRKVCDRAILKAKTLKAELGDKAKILREEDANP